MIVLPAAGGVTGPFPSGGLTGGTSSLGEAPAYNAKASADTAAAAITIARAAVFFLVITGKYYTQAKLLMNSVSCRRCLY